MSLDIPTAYFYYFFFLDTTAAFMVVHFLSLQTALLSDEQLHCLLGFMYAHYYPTDSVSWPAITYQLQEWKGTPKKRTVKLRFSSSNTQKQEKKKICLSPSRRKQKEAIAQHLFKHSTHQENK